MKGKDKIMKKAMVAMSGGVDSSVALVLLKDKYELTGVTLKLFDSGEIDLNKEKTCCSLSDVEDARSVAHKFDVPHFVYNFGEKFAEKVVDKFVDSYVNAKTPNPCIDCNRFIKFDALLQRAKLLDQDYIVTGHYVRRSYDEATGRYLLKKAVDDTKDQSYVLYGMTQEQLAMTLFPLGEYEKKYARKIADESGLVNADKPDSQDICFVKNGKYGDFIEDYTGIKFKPGNFIDTDGKVVGKHKGIINYTIGQRKGLGVAFGEPMYVVDKNAETNTVTVGREEALFSKTLVATDVNYISVEKLEAPMKVKAKTRYKQVEQPATITPMEDGNVFVEFDEPQRAVTSGQAVVFYDGDVVVGGGTIV